MKMLTADQVEEFKSEGYVKLRGLLAPDEIGYLRRAYEEDEAIHTRAMYRSDARGGQTEIALWNDPGEDVFGAVARCDRIVGTAEQLLGDEVYHYHSKVNTKRPGGGGTWVWHQDYGYWYHNGCIYPDMLTVAVALTPMTAENGCLQFIPGSNRMGRIEHQHVGDQTGADPERVKQILERVQPVRIEATPGDVVFFHCNVLHTSEPNQSDIPRVVLLVAYNTRHNDPYRSHHHPRYKPLGRLPDSAIRERAMRRDGEARTFMGADEDR